MRVKYVRKVNRETPVYDLQTGTHNFFAHSVLVHNCYTEANLTVPFGGACHIGCKFCYVAHGTRGYRATGIAAVNPNYPDYMQKSVAKLMVSGAAYISSFTEPFQHLEQKYHITQRLSQVFVDEGLPLFYLTRLLPPDWAVEALLQNSYSYMQWSINTSNEKHRKLMSPGTAKLDDVLEAMGRLSKAGIFISIQCNPILAGITTLDELVDLVGLITKHGGHHIIFKFAEQVYSNRTLLLERLSKARLPHVDKFDQLLNQTIGGVYTIQQDVRIEWLKVLLAETRKAGITMSTCYEYYDDGYAGANLAPWVTTSDQCHGRGVPVYYRYEPEAPFAPLPGCFRKGCLYCADYGAQACGNNLLLDATALDYKDLRECRIEGGCAEEWEKDWELAGSCLRPEDVRGGHWWNPDWLTDAQMWGWRAPIRELKDLESPF